MSLLDEYKKLDEERLEDGKKSVAHYKTVDLPGKRVVGNDASARERIAAMNKERDVPNHE